MTAISIVAIWMALLPVTNVASKVVLAIYGLTYLFGCNKTRRAVLILLPAMYLPYLWLFADWQDWPWHGYRWQWIGMLWVLPGLLAEMSMHPLAEPWFSIVVGLATLAVFFTFVMAARPSLRAAITTGIILVLLNAVNSSFCLAIYRV